MAILRLEAVVLKTHALGDTSRIVVLYSRELGVVRAVAKGARQPKSKFAGALQPLTRIAAHVYLKEGRDLQLLSSAEPVESYAPGDADLERLAHAQAAVEFVDRLVWGEERHADLYDLLVATLSRMSTVTAAAVPAVTVAFQVQGTSLLGYRPVLERCANCDRPLGASRVFAPHRGGLVCGVCAPHEPVAVTLSADALADLRRLLEHDLAREAPYPSARAGELLKVMEAYLQTHFQKFGGFRSLAILHAMEAPGGRAAARGERP